MAHRTCHGPEQAQTVKNTGIPPLKTRPLPAQIQVSAISDTKKAVPRPTGCTAFFLFSIVSFSVCFFRYIFVFSIFFYSRQPASFIAADLADTEYAGNLADLFDQFLCRCIVEVKNRILDVSL